jgi:glycosyltransferase involved in cell wall biosynthesis
MPHSKRKKIVYILGTLQIGGTERQVVETATRLNRDHFHVKVYGLSEDGPLKSILDQQGISTTIFNDIRPKKLSLPAALCRYSRKFWRLYWYLRQERPEIVHCYHYSPSIYGGIAAKLTGTPVLITNRRCLGLFKDALPHYQLWENLVNRFTERVLVNSEALKADVLQRELIAPEKVHVIYNGVDLNVYRPIDVDVRGQLGLKKRALGIPEAAPVIGILANLIPYKGHRDLLLAAAEVHRFYPEARFVCIGEDRGIQPQLEQLRRELDLHHQVLFVGNSPNVPEMLQIFDIQVSASHEESFSNAILEGMASGKPIVATSVGGSPEAVLHNITGLLVPPREPITMAQAITSILAHPDFALQLGHNGRKRIEEHFSLEKMIDKLENLYLTLCEK